MAIFQDYISLKQAGHISGYHPDYIGALIRSGKVKGKKIGKNWMVSESDVRAHFSRKHYAPISKVFSTKKRLARIVTIAIFIFVIIAGIYISSIAAPVSNPSIKANQSLTDPVEPQSTDAEVGQVGQVGQ
jgi:hypothetical protein